MLAQFVALSWTVRHTFGEVPSGGGKHRFGTPLGVAAVLHWRAVGLLCISSSATRARCGACISRKSGVRSLCAWHVGTSAPDCIAYGGWRSGHGAGLCVLSLRFLGVTAAQDPLYTCHCWDAQTSIIPP